MYMPHVYMQKEPFHGDQVDNYYLYSDINAKSWRRTFWWLAYSPYNQIQASYPFIWMVRTRES